MAASVNSGSDAAMEAYLLEQEEKQKGDGSDSQSAITAALLSNLNQAVTTMVGQIDASVQSAGAAPAA